MELLKVTCRGYTGYLKNLSATGFGYYDLEIEPGAPCTSIVCESVTLDEMCLERKVIGGVKKDE